MRYKSENPILISKIIYEPDPFLLFLQNITIYLLRNIFYLCHRFHRFSQI